MMRLSSLLLLLAPVVSLADPLTAPAAMTSDPNANNGASAGYQAANAGPGALINPLTATNGGIGPLSQPVHAPTVTEAVNDTLVLNPYAPQFQSASDAAPRDPSSDEAARTQLAKDAGPEVKIYGPAQNFWDKHPASPELVPLFRYWNPSVRDHFYTADFGVFGSGREGWVYQGIQMYVYKKQVEGTVPLYRYWNVKLLDDYYTVSPSVSPKTGYKLKGVACYVFPKQVPGSVPLYRYFNQELADHYYTHNYNVMQHGRDGWVLQGIAAYAFPHPHDYVVSSTGTGSVANYTSKSPDNLPGHLIAPTMYVPPANASPKTKLKKCAKGKKGAKCRKENAKLRRSEKPPKNFNALPAEASGDTPLLVPLYRYWNSIYRDHFYTTLWTELGAGGHNGWEYQGVQAMVYSNPQPGSQPLHRYWNVRTLDHFYTTNFKALGKGKDGWRYEGVAAYIDAAQSTENVPLFRYFSDQFSDHFYTTRFIGNETRSWVYEGVQGYVHPSWFTDC